MPKRTQYEVRPGQTVRVALPRDGESAPPVEEEDRGKALQPSDETEETYAFRKTALIEFYQINFAPSLFDASASEVIGGLYSADFKAWYLSLGNTEDDFNASHPNWALMSAEDSAGGFTSHGTEAGGASLTLAKTKAIDAALLAGFSPDLSTPLNARGGEWIAETFALQSDPNNLATSFAGLTQTRLYNPTSPYGQLLYARGKQKTSDHATNKMRFPKPMSAIETGDGETWARFKTGFDPDFPFAPGQSGFKVTKTPSFDAERADLRYAGGTLKVFLKPLPRVFSATAVATYFFPYPFWRDESGAFQDGATRTVRWGGQFSVVNLFENWYNSRSYPNLFRSFEAHWNARAAASGEAASGITAFKSESATKADERFDYLIEQNGWGNAGEGYVWFPSVYSGMVPNTEAEALAREAAGDLPRYYDDLPHGYFLHNGTGGVSTSRWQYEGEFVGAVEYQGEVFYVWRYTNAHKNLFTSPSKFLSFNVSNAAWELEPRFIYDSETTGNFNPTESDHHKAIDTDRPQFVHVHYSQGGLGDFDGDVSFFYPPKFVTNFGLKPRRFQT